MIKAVYNREITDYITAIEINRYRSSNTVLQPSIVTTLQKNSLKKSSYASNRIEGNPLTEQQAEEIIYSDRKRHYLKPELEIRNYYLALNYLIDAAKQRIPFSRKLIMDVQKLVVKGSGKGKSGLRGPTAPGVLFAVYDSLTGRPDYIPPQYDEIPALLDELVDYVTTTDDHPLLVAAIVHYQLVTIHPFLDGNGRTARLLSSYILDINGYGFNRMGSLEEYFAYDVNEYYSALQMDLPPLYYLGRNDPPFPEKWLTYFLRMVRLYSQRICELADVSSDESILAGLTHLNDKETDLLLFLLKNNYQEFTPIQISKQLKVTNKTVINRTIALCNNGFVIPVLVNQRIRSYLLSDFAVTSRNKILNARIFSLDQ